MKQDFEDQYKTEARHTILVYTITNNDEYKAHEKEQAVNKYNEIETKQLTDLTHRLYVSMWHNTAAAVSILVALRVSTSEATIVEWERSARAGGVLCKVLMRGKMVVYLCVYSWKELLMLRAYVRSRRRKVRGVSAMFFLGACVPLRQCCLIHLICFCKLPRAMSRAPYLLPNTLLVVHECASPAS